ncbi:HAD-IA family hydrolase [Allostreptomyces psammosilenae]|uniref:Sugar-phosphatase n=1 Tax=Allostreptomyces psammosilenae TaxID=1892865 RepID=A0A852ZTM1_9ACTN|nr:HAD-IA family hydrolase [Allostreptomyces psammosilenae]NYI04124.1 sugar-phosphatase [Allostreptomyces psammosilenae]
MILDADALLFDMDGTLVDSGPVTERCWALWAEEFGIAPEDFARVYSHGQPSSNIVTKVLPRERWAEGQARIEELEVSTAEGLVLLPGARELLASLDGAPWAIVTSCSVPLAEARMGAAGLTAPLVVTADDVSRGKPSPEPFLLGAQKLGVAPERCLVFEDAPAGVAAARAAGMEVVALATTSPLEKLADATVLAENLASVRRLPPRGPGHAPVTVEVVPR